MDDISGPRDGTLTLLKWLVIALTATMLVGMVVLVTLFVTRFPGPAPAFPETIELPAGATPRAITRGDGWIGVVTDANEFLIFDAGTGALRQSVAIDVE